VLYDGRALNIADYPKAYDVWGTMYNTQNGKTTPAGQFRIPDMSGLFVVGYSASDDDYSEIGKKGGAKKVPLKISEMPPHDHPQRYSWGKWGDNANNRWMHWPENQFTDTPENVTEKRGDGEAHENRPPFFTVAYIGRIE